MSPISRIFWVLAMLLISGRARRQHFSCDTIPSQTCSCSAYTSKWFELQCPPSGSHMSVNVQLESEGRLYLQCYPSVDSFSVSSLTSLHVDVKTFQLGLCPLPDVSFHTLFTDMDIRGVEILQIRSPNSKLNDTLQKKHFEKLYNVTKLFLSSNGVTTMPSDLFEDMGNLTMLDMKDNYVDLPREIFYFTPKLEVLELGKNNLTHLLPGIFKNLERLRLLNLWGNKLVNLTRAVFSDLPNLEMLDLSSNQMETIRPDLFADLLKLRKLNLFSNSFVSLPQGLLSRNDDLEEFQMNDNKRPVILLSGFLSNLTHLKKVRLDGNKLSSLPEDTFYGSDNIETIKLNSNSLKTLEEKTFVDLRNLEFLDLSQNSISYLPEELFTKNKKLKVLKLNYNMLTELPNAIFLNQKSLEFLDLRFNRIKEIKGEQFFSMDSLKSLNISDNQLTTLAPDLQIGDFGNYSVLKNCRSLEDLQLANNSLTEIYGDWQLLLSNLHILNLALNQLRSIEINDLNFFSDVSLDLSNNKISLVNFWNAPFLAISHLNEFNSTYERDQKTRRKRIILDNNPLRCDCQLLKFVEFIRGELTPEVQYLFDIPSNGLKCHEPKGLEDIALNYVPYELLTCEYTKHSAGNYSCPMGCTCHYRPWDQGNIIECQNAGLQVLPVALPIFKRTNHTELNLTGNNLQTFTLPEDKSFHNVTHWYLAHNNLTALNVSGFSSKLQVLDMSHNNLSSLSAATISTLESMSQLRALTLHQNPWACDCSSKPLLHLLKYSKFKQVQYFHNVTCSNGVAVEYLEESKLCPEEFSQLVILCIIFAILGFLMAIFTALYYRYQNQIHIYCYSSKFKFLRWLVSRPDVDVDKKYDAFISYSHEDEPFVLEHLIPQLEENGERKFKLCLHFRDWVPGESIPNQILQSVQNSCRTIVVLSPKFLESVWGKVEFRTAHSEALKDGTARVIVLLYEDVGSIKDLDEELKAYLQMNTYVKWGSPWFWQQLYYAMPHPAEAAEDIRCVFGCFPRISNSRNSSSHEVLQNVQLKDGEVHYISDIKADGKDSHTKSDKMEADTNTTSLLIENIESKCKQETNNVDKERIALHA